MKKYLVLSFLLSLLLLSACKAKEAPVKEEKPVFRHDGYAEILAPDASSKAKYDIEIATGEREHARGLKFREEMADNCGMLFVFEFIDYHPFWMQDTYLSLDMLFIDQYDEIIHIERNTPPFSEELISPEAPVKYVLELVAGSADKHNISVKDKIKWHYKED